MSFTGAPHELQFIIATSGPARLQALRFANRRLYLYTIYVRWNRNSRLKSEVDGMVQQFAFFALFWRSVHADSSRFLLGAPEPSRSPR